MEVQSLLMADEVTESPGSRFNIIGTIERFVAKKIPFTVPRFKVFVRLISDSIDSKELIDLWVIISDEDGSEMYKAGGMMPISKASRHFQRASIITQFTNVTFLKPGWHSLSVFVDGKEKANSPIEIVLE